MKIDILNLQNGDRVMSQNGVMGTIKHFKDNPDGELCVDIDGSSPMFDYLSLKRVAVNIYKLEKDNVLDSEDWEEIFEPIENEFENEEGRIVFETYGKELEFVKKHSTKFIWTLVDGDDGELYIIPGYHLANRVHYLVTKKPWFTELFSAKYI